MQNSTCIFIFNINLVAIFSRLHYVGYKILFILLHLG